MNGSRVMTHSLLATALLAAFAAHADVVTDWIQKASEIAVAHQPGPWG